MKKKNTTKRITLDDRIKETLSEGPMVALYYYVAMMFFKSKTKEMEDDEICSLFDGLIHPDTVKKHMEYLCNKLDDRSGNN